MSEANRRARKKGLPDTLTETQVSEVVNLFSGKCAFCEKDYEHIDHFVPLNTDCVGTVKENILPLCSSMNISKRDRNPFLWAAEYLIDTTKFNQAVAYLADINELTVDEYRKFVFSCFEN